MRKNRGKEMKQLVWQKGANIRPGRKGVNIRFDKGCELKEKGGGDYINSLKRMPQIYWKTKLCPTSWYNQVNFAHIIAHIFDHFIKTILRPCSNPALNGEQRRKFCCRYAVPVATSFGRRRQRDDVNASSYRRPRISRGQSVLILLMLLLLIFTIVS